jgi:hypothetical protein
LPGKQGWFKNLIRGEFHFDKASDIQRIDESWKETDWFPSLEATLVLDRTGELTRCLKKIVGPTPDRHTPERIRHSNIADRQSSGVI